MGTSVFNRLNQWGRPLAPLCHPEWAHIPVTVATDSDSEVGGVQARASATSRPSVGVSTARLPVSEPQSGHY
jgi:hypothetical protein